MRQLFFKKAALEAKSLGNVNTAVELLAKAKSFNKMVEAAECGLPINIKDLPIPSLPFIESVFFIFNLIIFFCFVVKNLSGNRLTLYRELKNQLVNANECRNQFQKLDDIYSTLFYETLLEKTINDLQKLYKCSENEIPR